MRAEYQFVRQVYSTHLAARWLAMPLDFGARLRRTDTDYGARALEPESSDSEDRRIHIRFPAAPQARSKAAAFKAKPAREPWFTALSPSEEDEASAQIGLTAIEEDDVGPTSYTSTTLALTI